MIKNMYTTMLSTILRKFAHISQGLWSDVYCLLLLGEPDIDIPEE